MTCEAIDHFVAIMTVALTGGFFTACWLAVRRVGREVGERIYQRFSKDMDGAGLDKEDMKKIAAYLSAQIKDDSRRK